MNYDLKVFVTRRPHMRDATLAFMLHRGEGFLEQLFDHEVVDESVERIELIHPERWLNIVEERSLFDRIERYFPNIKQVRILTQSVYIIQCTPGRNIYIIQEEDELPQESVTGKLYFPFRSIPFNECT